MPTLDHGHRYKRPSGPKTRIPFLFSLRFLKDPLKVLNDLASKYGDISFFRFGRQGIYFVNHPDYIQSVLVNNQSKFIKSPGLRLTKRIVGDGLLTSEGEYHKRQRGLIQPAFDYKNITIYADVITSCGEDICREWNTDMAGNGKTRVIDLHKEMSKLTMSIISRILFGSTIDSETAGRIIRDVSVLVGYFNHLRLPHIGNLIEKLPLTSSREFHAAKQHLDSLIFGIIEDSKKNLRVGNQKNSNDLNKQVSDEFQGSIRNNSTDLLSILLLLNTKSTTETGSNNRYATMTDRQLRDEIMTLFLAGHETTANALTWTLYLISQHRNVESKIFEEIKQVLGNRRVPTIEDLPKLQYLRNVFTETLRLYPPAWAIGREAIDSVTIGDYSVPPGSVVIMSQYITHRDPRFFSEPNKFIPERWSPEMKINLHKFAFFPFGGGNRICMGEPLAWMEGILLLVTILNHWKMDLLPEHPVGLSPLITLRPKYGMKMIVKPR